jgi:hypothetical protein
MMKTLKRWSIMIDEARVKELKWGYSALWGTLRLETHSLP